MNIFCKHNWIVLEKSLLKSSAEIMREVNMIPKTGFSNRFTQKLVVILQCEKCGQLKKYTDKLTRCH